MTIKLKPKAIEKESFRIIEKEIGPHSFSPEEFALVRRVIHATADFTFAQSLLFHPEAIIKGISSIQAGKDILTDVNMTAIGINQTLLSRWGGEVICKISDPEVGAISEKNGRTRAETAIELGLSEKVGIVAIGNAPTALLHLMSILDKDKKGFRPDLVIGVPVGFVNAKESKELLSQKNYPFITNLERKGGSPVAAAIMNALLRLAAEK